MNLEDWKPEEKPEEMLEVYELKDEDRGRWGLFHLRDYYGCGPGISYMYSSHATEAEAWEAGRRRSRNGNTKWCVRKL